MKRILIVEPHDVTRGILEGAAASLAQVESHGGFEAARTCLLDGHFDFLVTNIRLGAYNGLHLVYLRRRSKARRGRLSIAMNAIRGWHERSNVPGRFTRWAAACR